MHNLWVIKKNAPSPYTQVNSALKMQSFNLSRAALQPCVWKEMYHIWNSSQMMASFTNTLTFPIFTNLVLP